ncbi:hypothetical protein Ahia01_000555800 [Argonauta hians]
MPLSFLTKGFDSKTIQNVDKGLLSSQNRRRLYSRSQSNISNGDIQSWLSKVNPSGSNQYNLEDNDNGVCQFNRNKQRELSAQMTLDQLKHHDEAQREAEEFLKDWVQKSLYDNNLLHNNALQTLDNNLPQEAQFQNTLNTYDADLRFSFDEDEALETVMQNMLKKELVPPKVRSNLGLDRSKEQQDPSLRMELRRKQVKENRLKKQEDLNRRRQEQQMKKEAQMKAHQRIMKILQQHFRAWTSVILQKRLRYGKVSALADWKLLLRHWNAWKSLSVHNKMEKEVQLHQLNLVESKRKDKIAGEHYVIQLLKKYFWMWQLYWHREKECRQMEEAQKQTKEKMERLLNAAASGKLNFVPSVETGRNPCRDLAKKADIKGCVKKVKGSSIAPSQDAKGANGSQCLQLSTIPWKASRQVLDMRTSQLCQVLAANNANADTNIDATQQIQQKHLGPPPAPEKFQIQSIERKLEMQKNFMKEQQKQLKEQQRLIEELQSERRHEKLKTEISQAKIKSTQISNMKMPARSSRARSNVAEALRSRASSRERCLPESVEEFETESLVQSNVNSWTHSGRKARKARTQSQTLLRTQSCTDIVTESPDESQAESQSECETKSHEELRPSSSVTTYRNLTSHRHLSFVKNLERRALERKNTRLEREHRKRKEAEEKLMMNKKIMEERLKAEKEERRAHIKAVELRKQLEKQRKAEQEKRMKELEELNFKADEFYKKYLLKVFGFLPLREFIAKIHSTEKRAVETHKLRTMRKNLISWHSYVQELIIEKNKAADTFYERFIIKTHFISWKNHNSYYIALEKRADQHFTNTFCHKVFTAWLLYANEQTIASWEREETAQHFYHKYLLQKMMCSWKRLPDIHRKEYERHHRKNELRQKVAILLPDFHMSSDSDND